MYRPVRDFGEASTHALRAEVAALGIPESHITILGEQASKAVILGSGDLNRFFEYIEIDAETADVAGLGNYLETHMPDSCDDDLIVPSFPIGEHMPLRRSLTSNVRIITLGANNPTIRQERATALTLTEEFFGVDDEDTDGAWPEWDYMAEVWLARSRDPRATAELLTLLNEKPWLLQQHVTLEPVVIDDAETAN